MGGWDGTGDWDRSGKGRGLGAGDAAALAREMDARGFHMYGYMDRRGKAGGKPEDLTAVNFEPPREIARQWGIMPITTVKICQESFDRANEYCPNPIEVYYEDWQAIPPLCTVHTKPPEPPPPIQKPCSYYLQRLNFKKWLRCILGINR